MSNAWNKTPIFVDKPVSTRTSTSAPASSRKPPAQRQGDSFTRNGSRQKDGYPTNNNRRSGNHDSSNNNAHHDGQAQARLRSTKEINPRQHRHQQQQALGHPAQPQPQSHSHSNNTTTRVLQRPMVKANATGLSAWNTSAPSFVATPSARQVMPNMHQSQYTAPHTNGQIRVNKNMHPQHQINSFQPILARGDGPVPTSRNIHVPIMQQQQQQQQDFPDFPPLSKATSAWGEISNKTTRSHHTMPKRSLQQTIYSSTSASASASQVQQHPLAQPNQHKSKSNNQSSPKRQAQKNSKDKQKQQVHTKHPKSQVVNTRKRQMQSKILSANDQKSKGKNTQTSAQIPDSTCTTNNDKRKKINFHKPSMTNPIRMNMDMNMNTKMNMNTISHGQHSQNFPMFPTHSVLGANDQHGASIHTANMLPMGTTVKGKQKIGKRKKIFTSLKKQILRERLMQWRDSQGMGVVTDDSVDTEGASSEENTSIVYLKGYIHLNEVDDDDEYQEILNDLVVLAERVGTVSSVHIPRSLVDGQGEDSFLSYVKFQDVKDALAARACWNGMVLGGDHISVGVIRQAMLDDACNGATDEWKTNIQKISHQQLHLMESKVTKVLDQESTVVILTKVLTEDDLEDEDCMKETLQDIRGIAEQHGLLKANNENNGIMVDKVKKQVHIEYQNNKDAKNAVSKMNGTVLGGATISASLYGFNIESGTSSLFTVYLENILSEDDYEDEECLEATKEDIGMLASEYGKVEQINIELEGITKGRVGIFYRSEDAAKSAVEKFNGIVMGGLKVLAWIGSFESKVKVDAPVLVLQHVITEDDFEDEDCMEETKHDLQEMLKKYGEIQSFDLAIDGEEKGNISVIFQTSNAAIKASSELHESMIGGCKVTATVRYDGDNANLAACHSETPSEQQEKKEISEPMYSGDKVIPEQYAECKRAPKVPNTGVPREYAKRINDESVIPLLFDMLSELMRLQLRAKDNKNAKARRRLVMGLREVCRGIRARKVKMIVMANNVDQYGALDAKLQEILDLAKEHGLPVIFELNKRKIGKALGKTIKVSVVGIENADGAYEPFKKLKQLYGYA